MSQSHESSGFSPGNFLWAALSLAVVLAGALVLTLPVRPEVDVDAKRGDRRLEVRKKINADEAAVLVGMDWADKKAGVVKAPLAVALPITVKELSAKEPTKSAVKVEEQLAILGGDAPALPSAPAGASTIRFPIPPAPAPVPVPVPAVPTGN